MMGKRKFCCVARVTVSALDRTAQRIFFPGEHFMESTGFLNPLPSQFLDLSNLFLHLTPFIVSNVITLDLDITNKYTTAKKKKTISMSCSHLLGRHPFPAPPFPTSSASNSSTEWRKAKGFLFPSSHILNSYLPQSRFHG